MTLLEKCSTLFIIQLPYPCTATSPLQASFQWVPNHHTHIHATTGCQATNKTISKADISRTGDSDQLSRQLDNLKNKHRRTCKMFGSEWKINNKLCSSFDQKCCSLLDVLDYLCKHKPNAYQGMGVQQKRTWLKRYKNKHLDHQGLETIV